MSDSNHPATESSHTTTWVVGVIVAALLYILSPPPITWVLDKLGVDPPEWIEWVYAPLIIAYDRIEAVEKFYDAYADLMGVDL